MHPDRRVAHLAMMAGFLCLTVLVCGCREPNSSDPSPARANSVKSDHSATSNPRTTAILAAYRASWKAFERALSTANAYDQGLAATMVGSQLQNVRANLLGDRSADVVGRGSVTLHPKIVALSATTASVVDCSYSTSELIYVKSGNPVPPITAPQNDEVHATLVLIGGMWKVSMQNVMEGSCASDS